ncbi:hypothetical protein JCGZ_21097 [Jatropha curcas]|uniref:Uncharacterized protein n=1 Tax=Jatropha curcas TaxID=180498 RepID=A0A067K2N4_JATCU|nr:RRP12-like protein isoform X2 [Jatropha curcas]KDP26064.1 hypothetical protein JCGZ_21097 [Jatropha curcas]
MEPNIGTQTIEESETGFKDDSDICQQLLSRYSTSKAQHHRHLLATAAAIRSILSAESLPLSPPAYFAAAIDNLSDSETLDSTAVAALLSFVSIIVPLIPPKGINGDKASEAVTVLVAVVERDGLGAASVSCVIKCLGVLILGFCDLEDWGSVNLGFETVLKSSIDKRPKVRRTAQDCLEKVLKSLKSPSVIKESSKLVLSSFKRYMPMALTLSELKIEDGSKDETLSKSGNLEILHMLNLLKLTIPYLSVKLCSKILLELPTLLKIAFGKDCYGSTSGMKNVPKVCGSIAGLLNCETTTARQASDILKEIIKHCIDPKKLSTEGSQSFEDVSQESEEADMIKLTCDTFESTLSSYNGIPNEHLLEVISTLFLKLRSASFIFMKNFVLKLADLMNCVSQDKPDTYHLRDCIGSAVVAMGPERILTLIPISVHADNFTCSNVWLVPILKRHIAGSSLRYYMEHIVPLAKSFMRASHKVKKSVIGQDLLACAHGLWELLPSFCNYPVDTQKKFGSLAELLITLLKEDSSMHQNVAVALQLLVSQNRSALISEDNAGKSGSNAATDTLLEFRSVTSYSKKTATRNIGALASWSTELLQALVDLFVDSPAEKRLYIKDAVGCLASITDSSITKRILMSLLERLQLVNGRGEFEHLMSHGDELIGTEEGNISAKEKDVNRCVIMELASSLIEGAKEDLINLIYNYVVHIVKETDVLCHCEAYNALSRILKEHAWLCSSRYGEVIDLLLSQKPPTDVASLRNRFACFHILMVHMLEISLEEENAKAFLMLNEIILTLKDAKDEARKVAYDTLLVISSAFRNSSSAGSEESYHKLISMIMGYLSGPSPHIKSGAVSALSALVYEDADVCLKMPDLVPSLLSLLQNKAVEVIKAALGFVKVIVSSLQANDLQNLLSDITSGILLWSTVSRFHFRSKVTVILEIMIRKCGSAAVEFVTPEKYKNFVKTVLQNRHHKSTSKEAVSNDVETVVAGSSGKRVDKKHKELSSAFEENGSAPHRKRKRKNKENETPTSRKLHKSSGNDRGPKGAKRARPSKYEESTTGQPADIRKKRNFIDEQTNSGKKRKERSNLNKEGNTAKFRRHDKFGGKKRKS